MKRILSYFLDGTKTTKSGGQIGLEIETQFANEFGKPIDDCATKQILLANHESNKSEFCELKLELGRQNIELNLAPQPSFDKLWQKTQQALSWIYEISAKFNAYPVFKPTPFLNYQQNLLLVQEERDEIWVNLDGLSALEHLCRCSSVQFTIDVNPTDAIKWIHLLWTSQIHKADYSQNDQLWQNYIAESKFGYNQNRYAGPESFEDIESYVCQLNRHNVVMHQGKPCDTPINKVNDLNINLFLRSIWWHYRLRRYNNTLALEVRPFSRRGDQDIVSKWQLLSQTLGI